MAVKFPLEMKNGVKVRNLSELKENFEIEKVIGYFMGGKLQNWLEDRYYEEEAEAVATLDAGDENLARKLCEIFDVPYEESPVDPAEIAKKNERIARLKQYTADEDALNNIEYVAFDQEELADLYDLGVQKIYLCEGPFNIPKSKSEVEYILIGDVNVKHLPVKKEESIPEEKIEFPDQIITPELANKIGWNKYVITDDYVVFDRTWHSFRSDGEPLTTDEGYVPEPVVLGVYIYENENYVNVWDVNKRALTTVKLPNSSYSNIIDGTKNKIIMSESSPNNVLVYDLESKDYEIMCEDWPGEYYPLSSCNGRIAYVDSSDKLKLVDIETKKTTQVDNIGNSRAILLTDNTLFYATEDKILYSYNIESGKKETIQKMSCSVKHLYHFNDKIYIIGHTACSFMCITYRVSVLEIDLKSKREKLLYSSTEFGLFDSKVVYDKYSYLLRECKSHRNYALDIVNGRFVEIPNFGEYRGSSVLEQPFMSMTGEYLFCDIDDVDIDGKRNGIRYNIRTGEMVEELR